MAGELIQAARRNNALVIGYPSELSSTTTVDGSNFAAGEEEPADELRSHAKARRL